ncbi:S-(hydroxymethyl)mycothiol dehydrogenase [Corynebacterium minutissimum]|uniref:Nitrosothiol reductase n=1 Tax=Corynebacterium minutissimum TaxID=38301 RepID=A0A2X4RFW8_9CORY|nr:S-(hydroxymethyl)mycothiol dehydrogenase [Corynebacterium minutissimum]QPS60209.1 S-(hydroxymethyl)mycothiol dehydrogenase [Corynebacterium minutissimum]QQA79001.1 S-(hydroxymethyl)mycothiol dehydrogenase [Corynebacterium minutissimum]SQI00961.1 nitrosothiol reductase [Corynebacterium minutissimum]VEG04971.1 nitrosothiol reductase [Corynebacterium minutissimum]
MTVNENVNENSSQQGAEVVRGVIARAKGEPVETVNIVVPAPGEHDVIVKVQACGVCHTDLAYRDGDIEDAFPFLLGHEAAGVVERVGSAVSHVEVGDFVILNWRAVCGECRACKKGEPKYCFNTHNASAKMKLSDGDTDAGTELTPALGIGSFAEKTLVHEGQCTKVEETDPAAAGLLGCGIMAGLGAAVNTADIQLGESVAVFGCGGVGTAAIAGAKLAGAAKIIAVDLDETKLATAQEFGATDTICGKDLSEDEVIEAVRELTDGFGTDVTIDAVGIQPTWRQAFYSRDHAGRMVMVGVPNLTDHVDIPAIDLYGRGGSIKPAWYGDCLPERDFPAYVSLSKNGQFPLDKFVSERIALDDVEEAFGTMKAGKVLRSVVEF